MVPGKVFIGIILFDAGGRYMCGRKYKQIETRGAGWCGGRSYQETKHLAAEDVDALQALLHVPQARPRRHLQLQSTDRTTCWCRCECIVEEAGLHIWCGTQCCVNSKCHSCILRRLLERPS